MLLPELVSTLLPKLLVASLLARVPPKPVSNPPSLNHDPNARCPYHVDAPEHSLENCRLLNIKSKTSSMQDLFELTHKNSQDTHTNPLRLVVLGLLSTWSFVMMRTLTHPSQLIMPTNDSIYFLIATQQKEAIPLVAPFEYTPTNPFVLKTTSTSNVV